MLFASVISGALGILVARSLVAESDAHRSELPDNWLEPRCAECSSPLGLTMLSCRREGHGQRRINLAVLVLSVALPALLPSALPNLWLLPAYVVFSWAMILLTVTDLDTLLIPNRILGPVTIAGAVLLVGGHLVDSSGGSLLSALIGGASYFLVMLVLALVAKGGLGFGDVKMAFLIGVFTTYLSPGFVLIAGIGGFLIGGFVSIGLLATRRSGRKDSIAFGPFMTVAAMIAVFFGDGIITWYLR